MNGINIAFALLFAGLAVAQDGHYYLDTLNNVAAYKKGNDCYIFVLDQYEATDYLSLSGLLDLEQKFLAEISQKDRYFQENSHWDISNYNAQIVDACKSAQLLVRKHS